MFYRLWLTEWLFGSLTDWRAGWLAFFSPCICMCKVGPLFFHTYKFLTCYYRCWFCIVSCIYFSCLRFIFFFFLYFFQFVVLGFGFILTRQTIKFKIFFFSFFFSSVYVCSCSDSIIGDWVEWSGVVVVVLWLSARGERGDFLLPCKP